MEGGGLPQAVSRQAGVARLLQDEGNPREGDQGKVVQRGRQPDACQVRNLIYLVYIGKVR